MESPWRAQAVPALGERREPKAERDAKKASAPSLPLPSTLPPSPPPFDDDPSPPSGKAPQPNQRSAAAKAPALRQLPALHAVETTLRKVSEEALQQPEESMCNV